MTPELMAGMAQNGVLYHGLEIFGAGAILTGLVLAAIAVFVIERKFEMAAVFALGRRGADLLRLHARRGGRASRSRRWWRSPTRWSRPSSTPAPGSTGSTAGEPEVAAIAAHPAE